MCPLKIWPMLSLHVSLKDGFVHKHVACCGGEEEEEEDDDDDSDGGSCFSVSIPYYLTG